MVGDYKVRHFMVVSFIRFREAVTLIQNQIEETSRHLRIKTALVMSEKQWSYTHRQHLEVLHSTHSLIIKHLFNYTNHIHNIYSFHIFTVFLLHVLVLHHHHGEFCVFYSKPYSNAAIVYGYYNSYVINIKGRAGIYWSYNNLYNVWS
jgi:hypothetical protein